MKNSEYFRNGKNKEKTAAYGHAYKSGASIAGQPSQLKKKSRLAAMMAVLAVSAVMIFGNLTPAFADDLVNTVPNDESYRSEVHTFNDNKDGDTKDIIIGKSPYKVSNVKQSTSQTSATTFASGLPLSTIYINQSKIDYKKPENAKNAPYYIFAGPYASAIKRDSDGRFSYDAVNGSKKIYAGQVNELEGNLFYVEFPDAAVLPNGDTANLRITYSNARIVIDQRYAHDNRPYNGDIFLAIGASFSYGGTDATSISSLSDASVRESDVLNTAQKYDSGQNFTNSNMNNPMVGKTMDATYQIVDKNGTPVPGTFIYAICGINLDRDPYRGVNAGNNYGKPLWYVNDFEDSENKNIGNAYHFFSEAMTINQGMASQYIYVRSNDNDLDDDNTNAAGTKKRGFYPQVTKDSNSNTKFVANASGNNDADSQAADDKYSSGFVTLADAAAGLKVTATGHGGYAKSAMNSNTFSSTTIWYRYSSSTGPHGTIQTTSEGNFNGRLNDGGDILGPGTYVATEGKTITYTMTPDVGYKLQKLKVGETDVQFGVGDVNRMKKGDSITVPTADASKWSGNQKFKGEAVLKYEDNGTYTLQINHATADEKVHVEWEPTTADILYSKVWKDGNDKDGMRKLAYSSESTTPKVKLQSSTNGKNWTDVDENAFGVKVASQEVPDGKDSSGRYLDGTYKKDNGTKEHPFTWEYLPVYSYDSSGRADKILQYRIVEEPDPGVAGYKNAQYFDSQSFDLTSEEIVSYDGWTVYRDSSNKEYVLKGDGKYYTVNDWAVGNEAVSQPDPASLSAVTVDKNKIIDGIQVQTDSTTGKEYVLKDGKYYEVIYDEISDFAARKQPEAANLTDTKLNGYFTADKALKYQSVQVKNEHTPREIYVDVTKEWNDERWENEVFKDAATNPADGNGYSRRDIKFVLSGKTSDGADVDLNGSDKAGKDLELIIKPDETDSKTDATGDKKIDEYIVYKDSSGNEFALVEGDSTHPDGYYAVSNGSIDYSSGAATGTSELEKVKKGDGTYNVENKTNEFGAMFEDLPTHEGGKLITYTVKEQFKEGGVWKDANTSDIAWTTIGGELKEIKDSGNEVLGYETRFVNTPVVDDTYHTLSAVLDKRDSSSENPLKDAVFTIYTDAVSEEKASSSYRQVDRYTVYTDGNKNYVLKEDGEYYEVSSSDEISESAASPQPTGTLTKVPVYRKIDDKQVWSDNTSGRQYVNKSDGYYELDDEGKIAEKKASPPPEETNLIKATVPGQVDETVLITGTDGTVTINFNKPGTYYMKETSAPLGYKPDDTIYTFEVNRELTSIKLKEVDDGHKTKWWERLFVLLFGKDPDSKSVSWNKDRNILTVMDDPVTANVLVRKVWNDNEDQDGLRPADNSERMPTVTLQWTLDGKIWKTAQVIEGSAHKDASEKVTHAGGPLYTHQHDAYTWSDLPAYRDGKRLTYRVLETGQIIEDSSYSIEYNETVDTKEKTFDLATTAYRDANGNRYIRKGGVENKYHAVYSNGTIAGTAAEPQPEASSLTEDGIATLHQTVEVSNKHIPQIINIKVHKKWVDENGSKRPRSVSLSLYKIVDGAQSKVADLTMDGIADEGDPDEKETAPSDDGKIWNGIFSELPAKEDGHFITYFIAEDPVPDNYAAQYIANYTGNDNNAVSNKTGRVETSAVKCTFDKTETIKVGDDTYDVYKDASGKKYVNKGSEEAPVYYAITESGGIDDQPANPQPSAKLSKLEDTSADITTVNTELEEVNTTKYWINEANANVRFYLYRTTQTTLVKSALVKKNGNAKAPAPNDETVDGRDVYVDGAGNRLVKGNTTGTEEKFYKVNDDNSIDTSEFTPQYRTWSPFDLDSEGKKQYKYTGEDHSVTSPITEDAYNALKDASLKSQYKLMMADGWELVPDAEHLFVSSAFKTETTSPGDDEKHKFESLPRYDNDGNEYTYRVLETTTAGATSDPRFEASYSEDGLTVTNTNILTEDGTAEVNVVKNLQGRKWLDTDTFYFRMDPLKNVDEATGGYTEYGSDDSNRDKVPMPGQVNRATDGSYKGYVIGRAKEVNTVRTTTGRAVSFSPILYDQNDFDSKDTQKVFYYRVYESDADGHAVSEKTDNKGITYDGKTSGNDWTAKYAILKVTVNNNDGKITTDREWFDSVTGSWSGNTPVFTNTYNSEGTAKIWIEKEIKGRNWETFNRKLLNDEYEGDAFQFRISSISGAHINMPDEEGQIKPSDSYITKPVTNVTSGSYSYHTDKRVSDHTVTVGIYGNPYTGDMLNDEGWANFIYAIDENGNVKETGRDGYASVDSEYTVDDLDYDKNTVYLKLHVQDNWDGTLTFTANYYEDAPCTKEITSNKAWVVDKTDISKRVLMTDDQIRDMADMKPEEIKAAGYREVSVAHFTNLNTVDIPVKKEWVGGPAVEDVTLRLERHLFPLEAEEYLDSTAESTAQHPTGDDYVEKQWKDWDKDKDKVGPFWETAGYTAVIKRGDFLKEDGTPKYNDGTTTSSKTYSGDDAIEGFNKDVPMYVVRNGEIYRAVYRLVENNTSDAYVMSYRSEQSGSADKDGDRVFIDSGTLVITNTVKAVNVAKVAAVKQLLGRRWLNSDDFEFEITPFGKAVYDKGTGDFQHIDHSDKAKAEVPMPVRYVNTIDPSDIISATAYSKLSDEDKENYKSESTNVAHARSKDKNVDPNGGLERLAGFDEIWYTVSDLTHDPSEGSSRMKGDFYYVIKEKLPAITEDVYPVAYSYTTGTGDKKKTESKEITNKQMPSMEDGQTLKTVTFSDGITYDCDVHNVHVSVQENRTDDLQVQIAYDYTDDKDISSGTQFTPVYTNKYDSAATATAQVRKRMMGRDFKDAESFDFSLTPVSGAPLHDADPDQFISNESGATQQQKEDALNNNKAIHSDDGSSYIIRLTAGKQDYIEGEGRLIRRFPKLLFTASDLDRQTATADELSYSNGSAVPAGTPYGRFVYAVKEIKASDSTLRLDDDTEYVRFTVIDTLDGDLDVTTEYFTDYYCTEDSRRFELDNKGVPKTDEHGNKIPSTSAPFVNQIKRSLEVTKAWADPASKDVVFRLQWSITGDDETGWYDVDKAEFMSGVPSTQTVTREASGDALTKSWDDLPAYANITDVNDQEGDTIDTNDKWLYYRVIEDPVDRVETYYNETPYEDRDTRDTETEGGAKKYVTVPFHTGEEKITDEQQTETWNPDNLKKAEFNITNFRENINAEERFSVVKKLVGKKWTDEVFSFKVEPEKSAVGAKASKSYTDTDKYTAYDAGSNKMPALLGTSASTDGSDSTQIAFDERTARFAGVKVKLSDLAVDPADGRMKGEFIYKISEIIPDGATTIDDGKYKVYTDSNGDQIKCTTEPHTVKIYAENDGYGNIELTVSYDDRKPGQFIPVFTNYVLAPHLEGLKTWRGGEESKHVNGTVSLDENDEIIADPAPVDKLKLKLCRKLETDESDPAEISQDLANRDLVIVWVKETQKTEIIAYTNGDDKISPEDYEKLPADQKTGYNAEINTVTERTKQEKGDGYYTVKVKTSDGKYVDPMLDAVNSEGTRYVYSISETAPPEKYSATCRRMNIVNRYSGKDSIKVTKLWDDDADSKYDAEGLRPDDSRVTMHLFKVVSTTTGEGDDAVTTYSLVQAEQPEKEITAQTKAENGGDATWTGLPVYDTDGSRIKYVVLEESLAGYKTTYKVPGDGSVYTEESEAVKASGYSGLYVELDGDTSTTQNIDVKNELTPAAAKVSVQKVWNDNDNVDGKRPENGVTFRLYERVWNKTNKAYGSEKPATYADGSDVPDLTLDGTIDDNTSAKVKETAADANDPLNRWNGEFTGLAQTKNGKTVIYYVKEETDLTAPGYGYKQAVVTGNQLDGFTVTNSREQDTVSAEVTKKWEDKSNELSTRPDTLKVELWCKYKDGSSETGADKWEKVESNIYGKAVKTLISADDEYVTVSGNNTWKYSVGKLPKNINVDVTSGTSTVKMSRPVTYYWRETVPNGYKASASSDRSGQTPSEGIVNVDDKETLTNTMITGTLSVTKTWDDYTNAEHRRPAAMEYTPKVTLFADGRVKVDEFVGTDITKSTSIVADNTYRLTYTGLPVYNSVGKKIIYSIEEAAIDGYTESVAPQPAVLSIDQSDNNWKGNIDITNRHVPETVDVKVTKIWINKSGFTHPDANEYKNMLVLKADSDEKTAEYASNLTVTSDGQTADGYDRFIIRWTGLPKHKWNSLNNKLEPVVYKVTENTINGYSEPVYRNKDAVGITASQKAVTDYAYNGGEIRNIQLISVDVEKTWNDNNDHDGQRPHKIKVTLYRNGTELGAPSDTTRAHKTLSDTDTDFRKVNDNQWKWTGVWTELPYSDVNGVAYNYTATETGMGESTGLWGVLTNNATIRQILLNSWNTAYNTLTFSITNTDPEDKVNITVDKIWDDGSNVDGMRPDSVSYKLYRQPEGGEKAQVTALPKGAGIEGGTFDNGVITVNTSGNDRTQGTLRRVTLTGMPKYDAVNGQGGKEIEYTIEETDIEAVRGYNKNSGEPVISGTYKSGITVKNVHTPVSDEVEPAALKTIEGRSFKSGDEFTFVMAAETSGAPVPANSWRTINPTSGKITDVKFGKIRFTGADMKDKLKAGNTKTFVYKVHEIRGGLTDISYDSNTLTYTVTVTRNDDGTISASGAWTGGSGNAHDTFVNRFFGSTGITIRKVWIDKDADGTVSGERPVSARFKVTAKLTAEADEALKTVLTEKGFSEVSSKVYVKDVSLTKADAQPHNSADTWEKDIAELPKYDNAGEAIDYLVDEYDIPNYSREAHVKGSLYTFTNTYNRTEFTGTKIWIDGGTVHDNATELKGKFTLERSVTPSENSTGSWNKVTDDYHIHWNGDGEKTATAYKQSFVITGLPKYDSEGRQYVYRIIEHLGTGYDDYTVRYSNVNDSATEAFDESAQTHALFSGGTVTNTHGTNVVIEGTKKWIGGKDKDHVNADDSGQDKLGLKLKRKIASDTDWSYLEYDDAGNKLVVVWDPKDDNSGYKGNSHYVFMAVNSTDNTKTIDAVLNDKDADGHKYLYKVVESVVPEGYHVAYDESSFDITNTCNDTVKITAEKVWKGDEESGERPSSVEFRIYREVEDSKSPVKKDAAGNTVTAAVTLDGSADSGNANGRETSGWTATWDDLPAYDGDHLINYTVEEAEVPDYTAVTEYARTVTKEGKKTDEWSENKPEDWNHKIRITNEFNAEETSVVVQKKWDDNKDQDGIRPDKVTVSLLANGEAAKYLDGRDVASMTLDDSNNWKSVFRNIPEKDGKGKLIDYTVSEANVEGYTTKYEYGHTDDGSWHASKQGSNGDKWDHKIRITNTHAPEKQSISAVKEWDGETSEVGKSLRTDVVLHLYGKDAEGLVVYDAGTKKISKTAESKADRTVTWMGIPKRHYANTDLSWEVVEDPIYGYTSSVSQTGSVSENNLKFTVTNTYAEPVTTITAKKTWDDANYKKRPESVTFELWRKVGNGSEEHVTGKDLTVTKDSKVGSEAWAVQWENLPVVSDTVTGKTSRDRKEYQQEMKGDKYLYKKIAESNDSEDTIAVGTEVEVTEDKKAYYDSNAAYEPVMEPVTVTDTVTETTEEPVLYVVKEKALDNSLGYRDPVVISEKPGEFEVVNARDREYVDVKVIKVWDDSDDADGIRPDHITLRLLNNGTLEEKAVVSEDDKTSGNTWEYTFRNLPKTDGDGEIINYTVEEAAVRGYTPAYIGPVTDSKGNREITIVNTHSMGSIVKLKATKVWSGDEDNKSFRSDIDLKLVEVIYDSEEDETGHRRIVKDSVQRVATGTDHEENMTAEWNDLPTVRKGKKIGYTVVEEKENGTTSVPEGYNVTVSSTTIDYEKIENPFGKNPKKERWYVVDQDSEGGYKPTADTEPKADKDYYEMYLKVTVTNTKGELPKDGDVIFVDPLNDSGKAGDGRMIVQSDRYERSPEDARDAALKAAEDGTGAPPDPKHEGFKFLGWAYNYDQHDNFVLVATYSVIPKEVIPVVSYVDGQAKNPLLASVQTKDPSSVKAPKKPKHKNLQFVGWMKTVDAGGNTIFVAKYKADCANGAYTTGKGKGVKTGDSNQIILWIATMFAAAALLSIYGEKRRRENRR